MSNSSQLTFRHAAPSDYDALVQLKHALNLAEHGAYPKDTKIPELLDLSMDAAAAGIDENWSYIRSYGGAYLVGEIAGEIVCCGCWYGETAAASTLPHYQKQANIGGIVVAEAARGRGLGLAIMLELEKLIRLQGILHVRLGVVPGNTPAELLYHKLGFKAFETIMIKTLDVDV